MMLFSMINFFLIILNLGKYQLNDLQDLIQDYLAKIYLLDITLCAIMISIEQFVLFELFVFNIFGLFIIFIIHFFQS